MEIKQIVITNVFIDNEEKREEKTSDEKFERFQELPGDLQAHVLTCISKTKTVSSLLSTCKTLYHNFKMWPEHHLTTLLSDRFSCSPMWQNRADIQDLIKRIYLALERQERGLSLPFTACGSSIDALNPQIPARTLDFHCNFITHSAPFLPKHLQKLTSLPLVKELSFYGNDFTDFELEQPLLIASITALEIRETNITTKQFISFFNYFPNLTKFEISGCRFVDVKEFIYKIEPLPLIKKMDMPLEKLESKDFFRVLQVFPNQVIDELPLARCAEINHIDLSQIPTLPQVKKLDVCFSPITVDTLCTSLEKLPNVELLILEGCIHLKFTEFMDKKEFLSVKKIFIEDRAEEEAKALLQVFPNAAILSNGGCVIA